MTIRPAPELAFLSIAEAARLLRRREISPLDLVEASLAQIKQWNPALNAFLIITAQAARRQARRAELELRRGQWRGPLHGVPVSLKDNFCTRGIRTTAGSKILAHFVPRADSEVAMRLARAGAILLGKTNMHEFAYGITGENPHYGASKNPWNRDRMSGGSSGGSAAGLAVGMGLASVGTDTGGSIRIPSALCGIVGLKPTFGLVSLAGVVPLASSLDHAGPLARSVEDVSIVLDAISGEGPAGRTRPNYQASQKSRPRRFRLGLPKQYYFEQVDAEVKRTIQAAMRQFETLGARIETVDLPSLAAALKAGTDIALAEALRYHQSEGYFPKRWGEYGKEMRDRLVLGEQVRAVDYLRGFSVQGALQAEFDAAFARVDAIVAPASPVPAPLLGQEEITIAGKKETVRSALVRVSRPVNLSGHPALTIPCGFTRAGLPVGLQMIGPRWGEARLLAIAHLYEESQDGAKRFPVLD